jgi:hypothetical protein
MGISPAMITPACMISVSAVDLLSGLPINLQDPKLLATGS